MTDEATFIAPRSMPSSADERYLRRLLAYRVAMPGAYYDDGEAQGQEHGIVIDFLRDPVADIEAKLRALNVARLYDAEAAENDAARRMMMDTRSVIGEPTAADIIAGMQRIEAKLEQLLGALAGDEGDDDDDDGAVRSLDGQVVSRPRNENESLG